jgi:hypothetical protein
MSTRAEPKPDRSNWPEDVEPITLDSLARLGIDRDDQLYWDGKRVEIQQRLKLSCLQTAFALVVGLAAIIGGFGTGLNEGFDLGCKRAWWTQGCPKN